MRWLYRSVRVWARHGVVFDSRPERGFDTLRELILAATLAFAAFGGIACSVESPGGSTGGGAHANPGDTVGSLELGAPTVGTFTLHGTLPVPPRIYPALDDQSPFQVTDADGTRVNAQTEIVSRYASPDDGADVVEVIARVHTPPSAAPGDRIRYDVVYQPHRVDPFVHDPDSRALLTTPGAVTVRARDVFGNVYAADLLSDWRADAGSLRLLKHGSEAIQVATHESLLPLNPQSGPSGTLPHLMGVHTYVTEWAGEPIVSLDLRVHDAHSGLDPDDPGDDALGKIYFQSLELVLPIGWTVFNAFPDPYWGFPYDEGATRVWPVVAPISGGAMHVMPEMSQFQRRLILVREGFEARAFAWLREEGLGFCRAGPSPSGPAVGELWSWWNPLTARYFPQRQTLPSLDHVGLDTLRAADNAQLGTRAGQVMNGTTGPWPTESTGLGWAHPWGIQEGGMVSGLEIHLYEGVASACAASQNGYRFAQLVHRMLSDRQPNMFFDANGLPTRLEEWIVHGPQGDTLPIWWYGGPMLWAADPFGVTTSPSFQRDAVAALGLQPPWEGTLLGYQAIDSMHLIRYTRMAKELAWLGNDAIAKDDLRAQAESVRFGYSMYPQNFGTSGVIPTGMLANRGYVDTHPGWGFAYGRSEGWGLDTMNAAYSLGDPQWRADVRPWFDLVIDLVRDGQMDCTGILQASWFSTIFNAQYRCRQAVEASICENALLGMRESVFRGVSSAKVAETDAVLRRMFYAGISPLVWDPVGHGPWAMIAVGSADVNQPPFCSYWPPDGNYGYPDHALPWNSFAYAYAMTHDPQFLNKAAEAMGGGDLKAACYAMGANEIQNRAALLALAESL